MRSNQFECPRCGDRKIKFLNRKNANVCSCGSMMEIYVKKTEIPLPPIEMMHVPMFSDEAEEPTAEFDISNLLVMHDGEEYDEEGEEEGDEGCGEEWEEEGEC